MSHDGILRPATEEDIDELVAMWAQYMHAHAHNPAYRNLRRDALATRRRTFKERIEEATSVVFVIEGEDEGLDGMIVCFVEENEPYFQPLRYVRIQTPYVRPEARRRGYLMRLLEAAYEWAGDWEFDEVRLYTGADNLIANAVADELGFEAVEVVRRRPLRRKPRTPWDD
ncbi:MAG: GNAT family N-acetyltransferase [Gemmatimonadota bacterium]|nr:GNAT family N-acetyltransferase [Gemmatimonadota bacterium]